MVISAYAKRILNALHMTEECCAVDGQDSYCILSKHRMQSYGWFRTVDTGPECVFIVPSPRYLVNDGGTERGSILVEAAKSLNHKNVCTLFVDSGIASLHKIITKEYFVDGMQNGAAIHSVLEACSNPIAAWGDEPMYYGIYAAIAVCYRDKLLYVDSGKSPYPSLPHEWGNGSVIKPVNYKLYLRSKR